VSGETGWSSFSTNSRIAPSASPQPINSWALGFESGVSLTRPWRGPTTVSATLTMIAAIASLLTFFSS